jgi:hypothetical protein
VYRIKKLKKWPRSIRAAEPQRDILISAGLKTRSRREDSELSRQIYCKTLQQNSACDEALLYAGIPPMEKFE